MELRKIDKTNLWEILELSVKEEQADFVATNTQSILEAYAAIASGDAALPFGIYQDGRPVGFVMFGYGQTGDPQEPLAAAGNYCIWRFMIDRSFQRQGLGRKALALSLEYLRSFPCGRADSCWLSYEPDNLGAKALYREAGFLENGERCGEEIVAVKRL